MTPRLDRERWRAVSPLLDRALELTGEARTAWLESLRAEDASRAADVEALLEGHSALRRDGFLEGGPTLPRQRDKPTGPEDPPARIGPYRILRELGRGGMGRVYLAEQEGDGFRRRVALKVVEPGGAGAQIERRFRDERRILAGLEHPGIARFYDAGSAPGGTWFLALEYVEGLNLLEHAQRRDLPTNERLRLFLSVLDAVEFAHARSVVHRDLKPGNILVGTDDRPRLLDFGIAKLLDPNPDLPTTETRTELRALTPAYASPEQFRGDRVTPASDVFSLGVLLYELVSGVRPFGPTSGSRAALERAVLSDEPDPPSTASRRAAAADGGPAPRMGSPTARPRRVGRDLDAICLKALHKEPRERYASAAAFAQDLRAYLDGRRVSARRRGRSYRFGRFMRRHRGRLATVSALATAAAAIVLAASVYRRAERFRPPDPPVPSAFPFSNVDETPIGELERGFAKAPGRVEAGAALAIALVHQDRLQEAAVIVGRLRQIPGREADPLTDYADATVAMNLDELQRALVLFTRARDGALASGRGELVGQVRAARGRLLSSMGEREEGRAEMELARADFARAGDHASLARVLNDLAIEYLQRGEMAQGEAMLEMAVAEARAAGRPSNVMLANLAMVELARGRPDLAEPKLREVMELYRRSAHPHLGWAAQSLSEALRDLGRAREADPLLEEAVELMRKAGRESELAEALWVRGLAEVDHARLERIGDTVREIESAARVAGGKVGLGFAHQLRGRAGAARGDLEVARRQFAESRRLLIASGNADWAAEGDAALAVFEQAAGNPAAALRLLDEALARLGDGGAGHPAGFLAETLRARIDAEAGRSAEARRRLAALGEETARSPSVSRRLAFLGARAALARSEQRFDDARRDLESALRAAADGGRTRDSLSLRLDLAELELRTGDPALAAAAARTIAAEAGALQLTAIVARAKRLPTQRRPTG